jgi:hypothetical protein
MSIYFLFMLHFKQFPLHEVQALAAIAPHLGHLFPAAESNS